ncbi:uncharacterized protein IL334_004050 [Kwoniella shivajii]|uniref:Uncharacterized protein n=1 Tax=Kwoniella shivajii TaxID=564305 RepID=A0ABZ1D140_9TREE|nr:hypothetical protein IL334_004050 [Kwoniella shivajii]
MFDPFFSNHSAHHYVSSTAPIDEIDTDLAALLACMCLDSNDHLSPSPAIPPEHTTSHHVFPCHPCPSDHEAAFAQTKRLPSSPLLATHQNPIPTIEPSSNSTQRKRFHPYSKQVTDQDQISKKAGGAIPITRIASETSKYLDPTMTVNDFWQAKELRERSKSKLMRRSNASVTRQQGRSKDMEHFSTPSSRIPKVVDDTKAYRMRRNIVSTPRIRCKPTISEAGFRLIGNTLGGRRPSKNQAISENRSDKDTDQVSLSESLHDSFVRLIDGDKTSRDLLGRPDGRTEKTLNHEEKVDLQRRLSRIIHEL